jgi:hypothetical protein
VCPMLPGSLDCLRLVRNLLHWAHKTKTIQRN